VKVHYRKSWNKAKNVVDMIKQDLRNEKDPDKRDWLAEYGLKVNSLLFGS
jgi:hypothetical protein